LFIMGQLLASGKGYNIVGVSVSFSGRIEVVGRRIGRARNLKGPQAQGATIASAAGGIALPIARPR
jgi:hypothetical protein